MFASLKSAWLQLKDGKPGHRFRDRFNRRNEATKGRFNFGKIANMGLGIVLTVVGAIFLPAPGPGSIVLIIGLGLLGSEVQLIARFLDSSEVTIRKTIRWFKNYWLHASMVARSLVCLIPVAITGIAGYVLFRWYIQS